ncbi:MAG: EthD domain-containing protein [Pseudomonadales bacterium]
MIKLVMPMKRRPGMSIEEFREYYESNHRLIGEKYLKGYVTKYMRRFVNPLPDRNGELYDPEYDVILEIWYPDEETFKACGAHLSQPDIAAEIRADEEKLFDMRSMRSYLVDEVVSEF